MGASGKRDAMMLLRITTQVEVTEYPAIRTQEEGVGSYVAPGQSSANSIGQLKGPEVGRFREIQGRENTSEFELEAGGQPGRPEVGPVSQVG